ncbi:MAG: hypothetical protein ACSLEN_11290 [Candidatus Malihini olakiniferum]
MLVEFTVIWLLILATQGDAIIASCDRSVVYYGSIDGHGGDYYPTDSVGVIVRLSRIMNTVITC